MAREGAVVTVAREDGVGGFDKEQRRNAHTVEKMKRGCEVLTKLPLF